MSETIEKKTVTRNEARDIMTLSNIPKLVVRPFSGLCQVSRGLLADPCSHLSTLLHADARAVGSTGGGLDFHDPEDPLPEPLVAATAEGSVLVDDVSDKSGGLAI